MKEEKESLIVKERPKILKAQNFLLGATQFVDNMIAFEKAENYNNKWEMVFSLEEIKKKLEGIAEAYKYRNA